MKASSESEAFIQHLTLRLMPSYLDNCLCYMTATQNCFLANELQKSRAYIHTYILLFLIIFFFNKLDMPTGSYM